MNKALSIIVILLIIIGGVWYFVSSQDQDTQPSDEVQNEEQMPEASESEDQIQEEVEKVTRIGTSVEGRAIDAYTYGEGDTEVLFVGGIHGGYSWNTALVAYELIDHLEENETAVPEGVRVTVIPTMNPDGLEAVTGKEGRFTSADIPSSQEDTIPGRFNANNVDLNRNFACDWQSEGVWQDRAVSGGEAAFSEPESQAIKTYIETQMPDAVVVWYSAAGGVFASNCHTEVLSETQTLTNLYAQASGYQAYESFDFYEITGDMVNWLAQEGIPAISVLLSTHQDVEWNENKRGIEAVLDYYAG